MSNLTEKEIKGSVLVAGGGIAGMQAALDLAKSGLFVHLVQKESSIGGTMALLDKTFPTGDCAMCMISPKLVDVGRNRNIKIHSLSEVISLNGNPGNFKVGIKKAPRYVDEEKCTGCGLCEEICPKSVPNEYDQGMSTRKAIHVLFPQAYPATRVIDSDSCIYITKGKGAACEKKCPAGAIDFGQEETEFEIDVGAVIICPGLERYNPELRQELGYGRWPNVITSVQFERILSASGPYGGTVTRPSDGKHPKKIAWIQCVGSRDFNRANPWCSSVCCMYATKQAIIAREHDSSISPVIFYMDMRSFGKDFDRYVERAKREYDVRYQRAMISMVHEEAKTGNLILRHSLEDGTINEDIFEMVVLSVGFQPAGKSNELLKIFGIKGDEYGFPFTLPESPVDTSRPGVFVAGTYQEPKDIPETITQGSAVAGRVMGMLSAVRNTETIKVSVPPEEEVGDQDPRIGVFVCHCGINIANTVDIDEVVNEAREQSSVFHAEDLLYACSQDSQERIKNIVREKGLNRVVVASCTPRTHESLFQETIRDAGLNKYLFDLANIREQCAWCHIGNNEEATEKAKIIVRMSIAKAGKLQPVVTDTVGVVKSSLIIGGGVAGMTAALSLAEQGFYVHLVEKEATLGGLASDLYYTIDNVDVSSWLKEKIKKVYDNPFITVHKGVEVGSTKGFVGNFKTTLTDGNTFEHGAIIIASGASAYKPTEYAYGKDVRVITQRELEAKINDGSCRTDKTYVMIQCVGSREEPDNYCSRICCRDAIKNAIRIKENNPESAVFILYRDVRTYGFKEIYYRRARDLGIIFMRYDQDQKPKIMDPENNNFDLVIKTYDHTLNKYVEIVTDYLVLSTGFKPGKENQDLCRKYKLALNADGFFLEAHVKLRPLDFASEGIFLCGLAHGPKNFDEGICQALAAAGRAGMILSNDSIEVSGAIAKHDESKCVSCLACFRVCPFGSPYLNEYGRVRHNEVKCMGCGICAGICPAKAFQVNSYSDDQIISMIDAFTEHLPSLTKRQDVLLSA